MRIDAFFRFSMKKDPFSHDFGGFWTSAGCIRGGLKTHQNLEKIGLFSSVPMKKDPDSHDFGEFWTSLGCIRGGAPKFTKIMRK